MHDAPRRILTVILVLAIAGGAFFLLRGRLEGYGLLDFIRGDEAPGDGVQYTLADSAPIGLDASQMLARLSRERANLMDAVRPSVVSINTTKRLEVRRVYMDWLRGLHQKNELAEQPGLGSGTIVSKEGHVLTNFHVIADVDEIEVTTNSGRTYDATVIGSEPGMDLAVLKIQVPEGKKFPALNFGNSSVVRVGEIVFAVGNPFGLGESVTQGVVSSLPRLVSDSGFKTFQTDTVINPGNSGGPLVNIQGEIVGINNAIFTVQESERSWQGVGFAIPSNDAKETFESIMRTGKSFNGFLGVNTRNLPQRYKMQLGITDNRGVVILEVAPDSPAEAAGLRRGDVVLEFAGKPVTAGEELIGFIGASKIGGTVEIHIVRDGQAATIHAAIGDKAKYHAAAEQRRATAEGVAAAKISDALGITVRELSIYERHRLKLPPNAPGIMITEVAPESPMFGKLEPFDLPYRLNDTPITSTRQFFDAFNQLPFDEKAVLWFWRDGFNRGVPITPRRS